MFLWCLRAFMTFSAHFYINNLSNISPKVRTLYSTPCLTNVRHSTRFVSRSRNITFQTCCESEVQRYAWFCSFFKRDNTRWISLVHMRCHYDWYLNSLLNREARLFSLNSQIRVGLFCAPSNSGLNVLNESKPTTQRAENNVNARVVLHLKLFNFCMFSGTYCVCSK